MHSLRRQNVAANATVDGATRRLKRLTQHAKMTRRGRAFDAAILGAVALATVAWAGCGGDDAKPPSFGDGGIDAAAECTPNLPLGWVPRWRPPRAPMPDACSEDQMQREYAACESTMATSATCRTFRDDPTNATCIACLFSSENDPSYGAIIRVGDSWKTNTAGCIVLVDGDTSAMSCGSRVQAASACYDAACDGCQPFDAYIQCREQALVTVCRSYYLDAVCILRPAYSSCTAYAVNEDYFLAAGRLFCGPMKPAGQDAARSPSRFWAGSRAEAPRNGADRPRHDP
jgi:hypothetical protein